MLMLKPAFQTFPMMLIYLKLSNKTKYMYNLDKSNKSTNANVKSKIYAQ